eukprot:jgi/Mesvir1/28973/Mv17747-RA.1
MFSPRSLHGQKDATSALVEAATSELLTAPDWGPTMEICDYVNRSSNDEVKEVVKALKKRLGHKSPKVQLLALTVLGTCVKNCGPTFHHYLAHKDVLPEMTKIVLKRSSDFQVRDQILILLDSWEEALSRNFPQFAEACSLLRRKGISFPARPEQDAPIFTPPPHAHRPPEHPPVRFDAQMAADAMRPVVPVPTLAQQREQLSVARTTVDLLGQMLSGAKGTEGPLAGGDVVVELIEQCRLAQPQLLAIIDATNDEATLEEALGLHDRIGEMLERHERLMGGTSQGSHGAPRPPAPSQPAPYLPQAMPPQPLPPYAPPMPSSRPLYPAAPPVTRPPYPATGAAPPVGTAPGANAAILDLLSLDVPSPAVPAIPPMGVVAAPAPPPPPSQEPEEDEFTQLARRDKGKSAQGLPLQLGQVSGGPSQGVMLPHVRKTNPFADDFEVPPPVRSPVHDEFERLAMGVRGKGPAVDAGGDPYSDAKLFDQMMGLK